MRCGIRASRCGTKHIRKPIVLKPDGLEPVSEVEKEFEIELKMEMEIQIEIERETEI